MIKNYGVINVEIINHIAIVRMEEKRQNCFTESFLTGLSSAFEDINTCDEVRCVVVTGYGNYFSCGGTKEELISLYESYAGIGSTVIFTDNTVYKIFLKCRVPVIAAMQGHALGGGLAMASFADIMIMAREAMYSANFMNYGFTPGMGATFIIPYKFGELLSSDMMYTGRALFGRELEKRGAGAIFVDKKDVMSEAMKIAEKIVTKPLNTLIVFKKSKQKLVMDKLDVAIQEELNMHELTFGQSEVLKKIKEII